MAGKGVYTMKNLPASCCAVLLLAAGCSPPEEKPNLEAGPTPHTDAPVAAAAQPGVWTMDIEAAKKTAAQQKLPILLLFTGSDWCPACIHVKKQVFDTPKWNEYARENLMAVCIDFPRNTFMPQKMAERNNQLINRYHPLQTLPAFYILDSDGETLLGDVDIPPFKLAGITPEMFIAEVDAIIKK